MSVSNDFGETVEIDGFKDLKTGESGTIIAAPRLFPNHPIGW
ncbi:hypothetical protein LIHA111178_08010 [Litorimonas haliclonae]